MEVKSLLEIAAECRTDADAENLLEALREAFSEASSVSHLPQFNAEFCMEEGGPFVRFELNKKISEYYITMIRPEIRDGKLVVDVVTNHMLDGMGMDSRSWEVVGEMEESLEAEESQTVAELADRAKELAIDNHVQLLERVGVGRLVAFDVAEKSW